MAKHLVYHCNEPTKEPAFVALSPSVYATWNYFDNKIRVLKAETTAATKSGKTEEQLVIQHELEFHDGFIETAAAQDKAMVTGS